MAPWLALSGVLVFLDQLTKYFVLRNFRVFETVEVTSFFNLVLVYNPGAAFSFLSQASGWQRGFFITVAVIASVWVIYLLKTHVGQTLFCLALALVLGGAVGNLIDRVLYGAVVDFLDFHAYGYHWPAFNVADSGITCGAALLIVEAFFPGAGKADAANQKNTA